MIKENKREKKKGFPRKENEVRSQQKKRKGNILLQEPLPIKCQSRVQIFLCTHIREVQNDGRNTLLQEPLPIKCKSRVQIFLCTYIQEV